MIKRKMFIVGVIVPALLLGAGYGLAQAPQTARTGALSALADTSALASGAAGTGGDFLISAVSGTQSRPAIAYNSDDDEHLVVWVEDDDIYGQIFSARGVPQGGSFPICTKFGRQQYPTAVYNTAADQYLVVWSDQRNDAGDIYGQLVDADGTLAGGADPTVNFPIATASDYQQVSDVAYNAAADEYLVVWEDLRSGGYDVYGQRVDADGTLLGAGDPNVNFVISSAVGYQTAPVIAYNPLPADEYLVVWVDERAGDQDIYGQRIDADGTLLDAGDPTVNFAICTAENNQKLPVIAYNTAADEYLVAWQDGRSGIWAIYGQRVDADSSLLPSGSDPAVNFAITGNVSSHVSPSVAYSADHDQYLVVWQGSVVSQTSGIDIYGQRVGSDGTLAEQGDFAISTAIEDQLAVAVAYSPASQQYLVVWEDWRNGEDQTHIYGQRVWWPGLPVGRELAVSGRDTSQDPAVAYDTREHRYLVVWADDAGGDFDIYGQLYNRDGYPIDDVFPIVDLEGDQINPDVAYDRDARQYLVVFEGPGGIGGQLVTTQGSLHSSPFFILEGTGFHNPAVAYAYNAAADDDYYRHYFVVANGMVVSSPTMYVARVAGDGQVSSTYAFLASGEVGPCDVVYNPADNRFLYVWQEKQSGEWDILGRQVSVASESYLTSFPITIASGGQQRPRVVYNPDTGQYLVVWEDFRNGSDFDVYAQKIDASTGFLDGGNFAVASSATAASQGRPAVIYADTVDRYRIVFQDNREVGTLGWDLRGQWLGSDGANLGTLDAPLIRYPGNQLEPDIAYSEGSSYNRALTVWEDARSGGSDIYGSFDALDDSPPVARFTRDPGVFRPVGTTFVFNAWPSCDDVTPRSLLEVRWDVDGDGAWDDADFNYTKYVTHTFASTGWHTVTLEVRDEALLTDTLSLRVFTYAAVPDQYLDGAAAASGPTATLTISPALNTSGEMFTFDGSGSIGGVEARWDWENDGIFDTSFDSVFTATHVYTVAGDYTVRLEVRGSGGLSDVALHNITVVPGDPVQLEVSPQVVTVVPGEVLRFRVTGWDQYGNVMYNPDVTWSLTDTQAGTIDASGVFTASVQTGTYTDVALVQSGAVSDTVSVTIFWPQQVYLPLVLKDD